MDPCGKATSSITDNLKETPTLLQVSDVFFKDHQVKRNDSISEKEVNGCDLEQSDEIKTKQTTATVTTNVTIPSTPNKVKSGHIKMYRHGVIASSNLFLMDSYQVLMLKFYDDWGNHWHP